MKVSVTQGGTIVPILVTSELDSAALSPGDAARLGALVDKARIGSAAPPVDSGPAQPDRGGYSISVEEAGRTTSLSVADVDLGSDLRKLVDFVSQHPKATRRTKQLGS